MGEEVRRFHPGCLVLGSCCLRRRGRRGLEIGNWRLRELGFGDGVEIELDERQKRRLNEHGDPCVNDQ